MNYNYDDVLALCKILFPLMIGLGVGFVLGALWAICEWKKSHKHRD